VTEERLRELAADIDLRLIESWSVIAECESVLGPILDDDDTRAAFASLLRIAYGRGYMDALREDAAGKRGELTRAHGYVTP